MYLSILIIYTFLLFIIFCYSLVQLHLLFNYLKWKKTKTSPSPTFDFTKPDEIPFVTIQLPIYNEQQVAQRLIKQICTLEYPVEKLEIQVLDDSTDASAKENKDTVEAFQQRGIDIVYLHRKTRTGFKAGALKEGLKLAKGEFIAIFDADFLPQKDWLLQTIPHFHDSQIGVVQTRWGHLNKEHSLVTKIQAFALDFHFVLEQVGRNFGNHFINFNGTAGVWRKSCILDAGNWQGDTLTEDLDLSFRAQLKGWKFKYLLDVETPAELPIVMSAARSQQFRWNKGAAENFQKNYSQLLKQNKLKWSSKVHAFFHLLNSSLFAVVLVLALFSIPVLYIKARFPQWDVLFYGLAFLGLSTFIFIIAYSFTYLKIEGKKARFWKFIHLFLSFFSIAMGMSVNNTKAIIEGHLGKKSSFVRTPKFNSIQKEKVQLNTLNSPKLSWEVGIEFLLIFYFAFGIYSAFKLNDFGLLPFHLMLFFGFGFVFYKSVIGRG